MMTWTNVKLVAACASVAVGMGGAGSAAADSGMPDEGSWRLISPCPKEISVTRAVPLDGGAIILAGAEPKLRSGAEEINRRLTQELGASALPVREGGGWRKCARSPVPRSSWACMAWKTCPP